MADEFAKLHADILEAVITCLYRSWLHPESPEFLSSDDHKTINQQFQFLSPIRAESRNGFLTRGSRANKYHGLVAGSGPQVSNRRTRISQIISSYLQASQTLISAKRSEKDVKGFSGQVRSVARFASPYAIAQRILTDPEAIETGEIAQFYSKLDLLNRFAIRVDMQHAGALEEFPEIVTFRDLDKLYNTLERYVIVQAPYSKPTDNKSLFLLNYTACIGFLDIRLAIGDVSVRGDASEDVITKHKGHEALFVRGGLEKFKKTLFSEVEFTKNRRFETLPTLAEISNHVLGIPIALSGFTDLLRGGLKQGAGEGTVSLIRGGAGTGKTTLAISIQRAVEAIGIPTVFVTSEETIPAIEARRESVLSIAQKSHSQFFHSEGRHKIIRAPSGSFRNPAETNFEKSADKKNPLFSVLDGIIDGLAETGDWSQGATDFTKLFVVFDGVHNFLRDDVSKDDYNILKRFVERCRDTGAQVLLTSSKDWMLDEGFEYLVDNYFTVTSELIPEPVPFFERKFQILKTRHQGSMIGDHRMTIGEEGELHFQPNFAELLKKQARRALVEPKNEEFSYPFRDVDADHYYSKTTAFNSLSNLRQYKNCSTLLYGVGSASKADLALRILASPPAGEPARTVRVLVVSFLAPISYYENCADRFNKKMKKLGFEGVNVEIECLYFAPGMISAEDVYFQVASRIDNSRITLSEFDGVLMDGMHNVFVQFPRLMGKPELWTALTGLFRRCPIDFVLTYSDFDISPAALLDTGAYSSERATPLMVALTQTLDYGFNLVPRYLAEKERQKRKGAQGSLVYTPGSFELSCFIAHRQQISADEYLIWDKEKKRLIGSEEI